jgi:hypothetical protein
VLFFLAGFDTTSTLLCFATHQLATHPDVQTRLQEEIDMTLNKDGGNLTYQAVHGMKYLDMVVSGMVQKISSFIVPDQHKRLGLRKQFNIRLYLLQCDYVYSGRIDIRINWQIRW